MLSPLYVHFLLLLLFLIFFHLKKKKAKSNYIHIQINGYNDQSAAGGRRSRKQVGGGDKTALAVPATLNRHGHTLRTNQDSPPH